MLNATGVYEQLVIADTGAITFTIPVGVQCGSTQSILYP